MGTMQSQNYWSPFRDWNADIFDSSIELESLKTTEALLGIETVSKTSWKILDISGLKTTEALLGIETLKVTIAKKL